MSIPTLPIRKEQTTITSTPVRWPALTAIRRLAQPIGKATGTADGHRPGTTPATIIPGMTPGTILGTMATTAIIARGAMAGMVAITVLGAITAGIHRVTIMAAGFTIVAAARGSTPSITQARVPSAIPLPPIDAPRRSGTVRPTTPASTIPTARSSIVHAAVHSAVHVTASVVAAVTPEAVDSVVVEAALVEVVSDTEDNISNKQMDNH